MAVSISKVFSVCRSTRVFRASVVSLLLLFDLTCHKISFSEGINFNVREVQFLEAARLLPNLEFISRIGYESSKGQRGKTNTVGIISANGYPVETHLVQTEDGYILEMHRIPARMSQHLPVLLMHGNFQSSADWVVNSPANNSFAFLLSDLGYDVWLGNHRGNTYSKRHSRFPLNSHEFWDYSFHELGKYDMPAMVDYVLRQTSSNKLHYASFSYSTTAFFAGLATRPEYNTKIASGIVMGPSVFQNHFLYGLVYYISFTSKFIDGFINKFGATPILPHFVAQLFTSLLPIFCNPKIDIFGICWHGLHLAFGHDGGLIRKSQLPLITSVAPSSSGLKAWNHIVQLTGSRRFAQYDYGPFRNQEMYGSTSPPSYDLSKVTVPIALFVGPKDFLAHRKDALRLASKLQNVVKFYDVPYSKFCHLDFTYGRDVAAGVYLQASDIMIQHE